MCDRRPPAKIESDLPFGKRTAQRLMAVAGDGRLSKASNSTLLPPTLHTLHLLTKAERRRNPPGKGKSISQAGKSFLAYLKSLNKNRAQEAQRPGTFSIFGALVRRRQ